MKKWFRLFLFSCLSFLLTACICRSESYWHFYAHLRRPHAYWQPMQESQYFLVLLVEARHLDYTQPESLFQSIAKHPSDGSKTRDVGHAWIYLQGELQGEKVCLEGGHSGEQGYMQPRYLDGVMNYFEEGQAVETRKNETIFCYEPNPVKYLSATLNDGFFQKGSGGHSPTFAAKVSLTKEQFLHILAFIHPSHYPYKQYALTGQQCSTFVAQVAAHADLTLNPFISLSFPSRVNYGGRNIRLWTDPYYSLLNFGSPDQLEKSLMHAVEEGRAEEALTWYKKKTLTPITLGYATHFH